MTAFLILASLVLSLWFFRWPLYVGIPIIVVISLFALYRYKKRGILLFIGCFCLSGVVSLINNVAPKQQDEYLGVVTSTHENYYLLQSGINKYYVYERENVREVGDVLRLKGELNKISFPSYESRFDFTRYLFDKGVRYEIKTSSVKVVINNPIRINARKDRFLENFEEPTSTLIDALLFSRKNHESEIINTANSLNIIFLFSMCGIYLRSLMGFLEYLLKLKLSDKVARILTFVFLLPLYVISLQKVAVHRIFLSYGGRIINDFYLKKKIQYATLVASLGLAFLLINYHLAYQLSFLLGFGLSFLIMFLRSSLNVFHRKKRKFFFAIFLFAFLLPIHILNSYEIHLFQIVFQYVVLPLNSIFFFVSVFSFYTLPMVGFLSFLADSLTMVYGALAKIDIVIIVGEMPLIYFCIYYGLYFYLPYLIESHRLSNSKIVASFLVSTLLIASLPIGNTFGESIHFINVGQGDAILIQSKGNNILVDTGGSLYFDMAEEVLIPFFKKRKVYRLDALITTHNDFDHNGAAPSLMSLFPVDHFISSRQSFPLQFDNLVLNNLNTTIHLDDNDNSLVLHFSLLNYDWLLMGDASKNIEEEILEKDTNLDVDYLKIGHHGSNTSTCERFIAETSPKEAIISVGINNHYGHPHHDVLSLLNKYHVVIRRTDIEGTISYYGSCF